MVPERWNEPSGNGKDNVDRQQRTASSPGTTHFWFSEESSSRYPDEYHHQGAKLWHGHMGEAHGAEGDSARGHRHDPEYHSIGGQRPGSGGYGGLVRRGRNRSGWKRGTVALGHCGIHL